MYLLNFLSQYTGYISVIDVQAAQSHLGSVLIGPAGSGKVQLIKVGL